MHHTSLRNHPPNRGIHHPTCPLPRRHNELFLTVIFSVVVSKRLQVSGIELVGTTCPILKVSVDGGDVFRAVRIGALVEFLFYRREIAED